MPDCEYPGTNHSKDRVEVWHGEATPMILCGYHASTLGAATYVRVRWAREVRAIPHIPYPGEEVDPEHVHDWADGHCQHPDCAAVLPPELT